MRFEKVNDNKIRITLNSEDLLKEDIDFHSFMSDSIESQNLFLDMLDRAEKEIGFITKDYLIKVEAFALAGGNFILTITRSLPEKLNRYYRKKPTLHTKRSFNENDSLNITYSFYDFDDFLAFLQFYSTAFKNNNLAKKIVLYEYNKCFYLVIADINYNFPELKRFFSCITEFAKPVNDLNLFENKLMESGRVIIKHNAISIGIKSFIQKS